jgi:plastocyanin
MWVAVLAAGVSLAAPAAASAANKTVYAGGPVKWAQALGKSTGAGIDNFLINKVTIHVNDSVTWNGASLSGGFHTVDIPQVGGSDQPLITDTGNKVGNNVKDAAGNPFWFDGKLDYLSFNPALFQSSGGNTYNGSSRIDSGLPFSPKPHDFTVKFTTPGTFNYFCDVHYGMGGQVVVLPSGSPIPSASQDAATLRSEEKHYTAEAKKVDRTKPGRNSVSVGASGPGGLEVFGMFPGTLHIKAGTTVTFQMSKDTRETHTAAFGPKGYLRQLAKGFQNVPLDARSTYASSPYGQVIPLSSTSHGNGFANTGALDRDSDTPVPPANRIKFTKPGVYQYICLIHPFMHGTVVVSAAAARATRPPSRAPGSGTSPGFTG